MSLLPAPTTDLVFCTAAVALIRTPGPDTMGVPLGGPTRGVTAAYLGVVVVASGRVGRALSSATTRLS